MTWNSSKLNISLENNANTEGIKINLTVEQLQAAGYEPKKTAWNEEEDQRLIALVSIGDLSWKEVADQMPERTSKMCYSRYRRLENRLKEQWTVKEDRLILSLCQLYGENWPKISQFFPSIFLVLIKDETRSKFKITTTTT